MGKELIARKQVAIQKLQDGYTVHSSRQSIILSADKDGGILQESTTTTEITAFKGTKPIVPVIGKLPTVTGCTLTKNKTTITFTFQTGIALPDYGIIDIPVTVEDVLLHVSFSYAKAKTGNTGSGGKPGVDANLLDWVKEWNSNKTVIDSETIITPKLFAGSKASDGSITGTAIGRFKLTSKNDKGETITEQIEGIYGFKDGYKTFSIDNTGNVQLGRGNQFVRYNSDSGEIIFGSGVTLNWTKAIDEAKEVGLQAQATADEISKKANDGQWDERLTHIAPNGIFTGTLDASRITSGKISANHIDVESLMGLDLNFVQGSIGGWKIDEDAIYTGTKINTAGSFTSGFGDITIGSTGIRGRRFRFDSLGSGAIAGDNIKWDVLGNVTFSDKVALVWKEYADDKVDSLHIGGRNYCLNTFGYWYGEQRLSGNEEDGAFLHLVHTDNWVAGEQITVSFDYKYENFVKDNENLPRILLLGIGDISMETGIFDFPQYDLTDEIDFDKKNGILHIAYTSTLTEAQAANSLYVVVMLHSYVTGNVAIRNLKIEKGNKATEWSAAPEDMIEFVEDTKNRLTRIKPNGIYTGEISANNIKTGYLSADRIKAGSINADKLDIKEISTAIISGGNFDFTSGKVGGWTLSKNSIYNTVGSRHFIIHSAEGDSTIGSNRGHRGITLFNDTSNVSTGRVQVVQMGALANRDTLQTYSTETNYGFRIALRDGKDIFRVDKDGAHISNWNFDTDSIYRGTKNNKAGTLTATSGAITIGSEGIRGYGWHLDSNGNAQLGTGNQVIKFNANTGKIEFGSEVSLNWLNPINDIQVGGRNYIKTSIFTTTLSGIITTTGVMASIDTANKYDGYNSIKIVQTNATTSNVSSNRAYFNATKQLSVASYSMWVKASVATTLKVRIGGSGAKDISITTSWQQIKVENIKPTSSQVYFGVTTAGATFYIVQPMLVEGTKAMDWMPSPSDVGSKVTDYDSRLTYINGSGIYTGTIYAKYITAGTIDTARLNVSDLTSKIITAGNINALSLTVTKGSIGGFTIASGQISSSNLCISSTNKRVVVYGANASATSGQRVQMYHASNTDFGMGAWDASGNTLFRLGSTNSIAGWTFDKEKIYKGNVLLGSDGSITNQEFWKLNKNGSGQLAGGKIKWDDKGNMTFGSDVSSHWAEGAAQGRMMFRDPEFHGSLNEIKVYNNSGNGNVTIERKLDLDSPNNNFFSVVIQNKGTSTPGCGGFYWGHQAKKGRIYVTKIIAKIPQGRNICFHTNSLGTGGKQEWLTPVAGTGDWKTYICRITAGSSATTTNFFAIDGPVGTATNPVEWRLCYATVFDTTSSEKFTTTIDENGIYTGRLSAQQVEALTCTFTKGKIGSWTINADSISNVHESSFLTDNTEVPIQIRTTNTGSGYVYGGGRKLKGVSLTWHRSSNAGHLVFGQVMTSPTTLRNNYFGIQMMNHAGHEYFCLAANISKEGGLEYYNRIAGWTFDQSRIYAGTVSLGSDGTLECTGKWQLKKDGTGYVANQNIKWTANGSITMKNAELQSIKVKNSDLENVSIKDATISGTVRNPYMKYDDSFWINVGGSSGQYNEGFEKYDNVVYIYGINPKLPWTLNQSGRRITIVNYKWNTNVAEGYVSISAPTNQYFFEDGVQKSTLKFSREFIELIGYGDNKTFFGWIVINRRDLMCAKRYGMFTQYLAMGTVTVSSNRSVSIRYKTYTGDNMGVRRDGTGLYTVTLPWTLAVNDYMVMLTGIWSASDNTSIYATLRNKNIGSFQVRTQDDASANDGSFSFMVISMGNFTG